MFEISEMLAKLWTSGELALGIWETIYLTLFSTFISYIFGLPIGILLYYTDKGGIKPIPWLNSVVGFIVNIFRSIPFIILMVAMLPVAKFFVGTTMGNEAMIVMLVIAATPYIARMVESSLKEVNSGVIEAAQAMGTSSFQLISKVLLPEAKPSLIVGAVISIVTILGYSAMAGTIAGGGLGKIAVVYGHQRFEPQITWVAMILTVIIVQVLQEIGMKIAHKTDKRAR